MRVNFDQGGIMKEFICNGFKLKEDTIYLDGDGDLVTFRSEGEGLVCQAVLNDNESFDSDYKHLPEDEYLFGLKEVTLEGLRPVEGVWEPEVGKYYLFSDEPTLEKALIAGVVDKYQGRSKNVRLPYTVEHDYYSHVYKVPTELIG